MTVRYPRASWKADRRRKLSPKQYDSIRRMYEQGVGVRELGRAFGVSHTHIRIIVDAELKEKEKQRLIQWHKKQPPDYWVKRKVGLRKAAKVRWRTRPEYRKYYYEANKDWKIKVDYHRHKGKRVSPLLTN